MSTARHSGDSNQRPVPFGPPGYRVTTLIVAVLLALTLGMLGRPLWCKHGFAVWTWQAASACTSQHFGDPYSWTHLTHGVLFYGLLRLIAGRTSLGWRYLAAALLETSWEILENTSWVIERYRTQTAALGYYGDSILNSVGDLMCAGAGFALAARLPTRATVALCVTAELVLLAAIRDNLTLNIIMLLFPIPGIKDWQSGG